jgi:hypothetical protein
MTHPAELTMHAPVERAIPLRAPEAPPFPAFLRLLNAYGVDFLAVGRHAVAFHGCPSLTHDADLVVLPAAENVRRLVLCLTDFGFGYLGVSTKDFSGNATVTLGRAPRQLDLMTYIAGVDLGAAWARRVPGNLATVPVHFIDKADFLHSKRAVGRPEDLARLAGPPSPSRSLPSSPSPNRPAAALGLAPQARIGVDHVGLGDGFEQRHVGDAVGVETGL